MKAVRLLEYGGQLVFDDVPTPTIARDEILESRSRKGSTPGSVCDLMGACLLRFAGRFRPS